MATLTFLGATGTVTGSKYMLEAGGERLVVDFGLFQGSKELRLRNWSPLPVPAARLQWVVLTHAHIDHVGYIPRLVKDGFRGTIYGSAGTVDLAKIVLPDAGHLQEEDAEYANFKGFSKHKPALPLYTFEEALQSLEQFRAVEGFQPFAVSEHFSLRFYRAGHILGARMVEVTVEENGRVKRILFSGDLGRREQVIIREPETVADTDMLLLESTYGNRLHPDDDYRSRLAELVKSTAERGGSLVVPAFAVGRTQELLYLLRELHDQQRARDLPVHVDSPMAIDVTELYLKHREEHDLEMSALVRHGDRPFSTPQLHYDRAVEDSKALNSVKYPTIIISASGMATGGRVLHHLARTLPDHRNTILFVGFQAAGTRGQIIQSGAESVKIHGIQVPIRARVETIENLSAHADYSEILEWLGRFRRPPERTYLVHGEPEAAQSLKEKITRELHWDVSVPTYLQKVTL